MTRPTRGPGDETGDGRWEQDAVAAFLAGDPIAILSRCYGVSSALVSMALEERGVEYRGLGACLQMSTRTRNKLYGHGYTRPRDLLLVPDRLLPDMGIGARGVEEVRAARRAVERQVGGGSHACEAC